MEIRSEGKLKGLIYRDDLYVRVGFLSPDPLNPPLYEEVTQWWVRNPMDTLTRVRDLTTITLLNDAYKECKDNL